jgi:hypothetical protein
MYFDSYENVLPVLSGRTWRYQGNWLETRSPEPGDQIGRILFIYFGCIEKNSDLAQVFRLFLQLEKLRMCLFLTKNGVGYILGHLLANSSGHPVPYKNYVTAFSTLLSSESGW